MNTTIITHTLFLGSVYSIMLTNSWSILCGSTLHIFLQLQDPKDLIKKPSKACKRCQISIVHITTKRSIFGILWIWFARSNKNKNLGWTKSISDIIQPLFSISFGWLPSFHLNHIRKMTSISIDSYLQKIRLPLRHHRQHKITIYFNLLSEICCSYLKIAHHREIVVVQFLKNVL